jgi:ribosomal protein S18 acetylase RimI-like enzyme
MISFFDQHISIATHENATAITTLLNSAYRGETSRKGWTTEANLISGNKRTNVEEIKKLMELSGSVFLIYKDERIKGCVNLQQPDSRLYLGMLSVEPVLQGSGIGKKLLYAAEEYAKYKNLSIIYMTVIDVRKELIDWYKRYGYADTGERRFFRENKESGKHLQQLQFMVLEKEIKN